MNDFDYEVLQRKRLAQQAKYRKNGSKSKKCSLPSDRLTKKQLKGLNGEVMTYNLSKPMKWNEFKYMPKDLQEQYLEKLRSEHGAIQKDVAAMLGITANAFSNYVRKRGIDIFCERKFELRDEIKWQAFLNSEAALEPTESHADPEQTDTAPPCSGRTACKEARYELQDFLPDGFRGRVRHKRHHRTS